MATDMAGSAMTESVRKALLAEHGREPTEAEVQEATDYLYALAELIYEVWQVHKVEEKNKQNNNQQHDDEISGF